ncbi:MAG: rRNA pseudouridine synthase [Nannocystaceae bacterium]|nr:rRNA pseudouridine synthase [Nannocystaceae bacterium]
MSETPEVPGVRLQKVLAQAGVSSRRGGEALIAEGRVSVNGAVVTEPGTRVDPVTDQITVDGKEIAAEQLIYILLNKPDGVVTSGERDVDTRGRATVVSLLRGVTQRLFPVGRLDFHTRGALLLTNDGELSSRLTHPSYGVEKTYHVKFQGKLDTEPLDALSRGVTLEDGTVTKPIEELVAVKDTAANSWIQLTITQGLNRQVRRMGEAIGHPVLKLIRVSFADLTIDGLADGEWRSLTSVELARLKTLVAGDDKPPTRDGKPPGARKPPRTRRPNRGSRPR